MPTPSPDDQHTSPAETPQDPLSEEQLEQVAGAGDGRRVIDCEGFTAATHATLSAPSTLKQPE